MKYLSNFIAFCLSIGFAVCLPLECWAEPARGHLSKSSEDNSEASKQGPAGITLEQSYKLAVERSDSLRMQEEQIKLAQAKYDEVFGQVFPNLHVISSERLQNAPGQTNQNSNSGSTTPGTGNFSGRSRFQTYFSVTQPIFQGFRDWYTIEAFKKDLSSKGYDLTRRHQLLYQDVAEVFYQILMYHGDLVELGVTKKIENERIEELNRFVKLGRSREAEILAVQSDLAALESQTEQILGFLESSKELLSFLTGKPSATLKLIDDGSLTFNPVSLETLLSQSQARPDLLSVQSSQASAQELVKAAKAERWPAFTLQGNAYPVDNPDSGHNWDIMFKADLPIFEGGSISARIRQQEAAQRSAAYQLSETQRTIEREVRAAFSDFRSSQAQVKALDRLVAAAKLNYESQREDYKSGVVTNIDVLQAIKQMEDARIRLHDARKTAQIDAVKLSVAAGVTPQ
jgi:outer membrane protein TolC